MQENLLALRKKFDNGTTISLNYRKNKLQKLYNTIIKYEKDIYDALYKDLRKTKEDSWITEIGMVTNEIKFALKNVAQWMKPKKVATNIFNWPAKSYVIDNPLGVVLIISPWNYPFQLLFNPLVGAIVAGNATVVKVSEFCIATNAIAKIIIEEVFEKDEVLFVEGDGQTVVPLLFEKFRFDHVFYTGSTFVGKLIYKMAANTITPVTLELGGKSPCIVTHNANIEIAAKRIVNIKFNNCGQMCVTPDYVLVHQSQKEKLVTYLIKSIDHLFGEDKKQSEIYGRIITEKHCERLVKLIANEKILKGGNYDISQKYFEPTILEVINMDTLVMKEEIFGPILPIITYNTLADAEAIIAQNENPLSAYLFSNDAAEIEWYSNKLRFGGGCINNAALHLTNHHLPFGGRGFSGMGNYHGKYSWETFSHKKAILKTVNWFNPSLIYAPFTGKLNIFKKLLG